MKQIVYLAQKPLPLLVEELRKRGIKEADILDTLLKERSLILIDPRVAKNKFNITWLESEVTGTLPRLVVCKIDSQVGYGLFTLDPIKDNDLIAEYKGEILEQCDVIPNPYLVRESLEKLYGQVIRKPCIDASRCGNAGRFAQHLPSKEEAADYYECRGSVKIATSNSVLGNIFGSNKQGQLSFETIALRATENIPPFSQIGYDYNLFFGYEHSDWPVQPRLFDQNGQVIPDTDYNIRAHRCIFTGHREFEEAFFIEILMLQEHATIPTQENGEILQNQGVATGNAQNENQAVIPSTGIIEKHLPQIPLPTEVEILCTTALFKPVEENPNYLQYSKKLTPTETYAYLKDVTHSTLEENPTLFLFVSRIDIDKSCKVEKQKGCRIFIPGYFIFHSANSPMAVEIFKAALRSIKDIKSNSCVETQITDLLISLEYQKYGLALRRACNMGMVDLVSIILEARKVDPKIKLNIDEPSSNGNTALHWAATYAEFDVPKGARIIALLLENGANPTALNKKGEDYLQIQSKVKINTCPTALPITSQGNPNCSSSSFFPTTSSLISPTTTTVTTTGLSVSK